MDPRKLITDLKKRKTARVTITLYVNPQIYKQFKDYCESAEVGASELIEEFMRQSIHPEPGAGQDDLPPALRDIIALLAAMDEPQLNARLAALKAELDASNRPASAKRRKKAE